MDALRKALANGQLPADLQRQIVDGSLSIADAVYLAAGRSYSLPGEIVAMALGTLEITDFAVAVAEYMSAVRGLHTENHCAVLCDAQSPTEGDEGWEPTHQAAVARYAAANTVLELWLSVEAMR